VFTVASGDKYIGNEHWPVIYINLKSISKKARMY